MAILSPSEYLLMPIFAMLIYFFFRRLRDKKYKGQIFAKYFMPALLLRLVGAFLTAVMYQYYYGFGDTFYYYNGATDIYKMWLKDPTTALEMCFLKYKDFSFEAKQGLSIHRLFQDSSTAVVMQLGGLFSPFVLGSFMGISFLMTAFAFVGCWLLYRVFVDMYPHLHKELAYCILFLPSICFWGTGFMKESLTMGGLGMLFYGAYFLLIKRKRLIRALIFLVVGGYVTAYVKVYVILALAPAMVVWVFLMYREQIRIKWLRIAVTPLFLLVGLGGGVVVLQRIGKAFSEYSMENVLRQAAKTQWWLAVSTERDGGTGYSLGTIDPSVGGLVRIFPKAVNVTLYRPYIWETRKPIVLPSALESLFCLLFSLQIIRRLGIWGTIKSIISDPVILFCLIFAIIFAFAVGFSTLNFGSLARYKIPCLPFFFVALILLWDKYRQLRAAKQARKQPNIAPALAV